MAGVWKRTLVYLGLAEEDEGFDDVEMGDDVSPTREDAPQMVRTIPRDGPTNHPAGRAIVRPIPGGQASNLQMHVVEPRIYDDVQEFADRFKRGAPVIISLRNTEERHVSKILNFASGLVYGLSGRMQKVADQVYLLTPAGVDVSADDRRRLAERGFFGEF